MACSRDTEDKKAASLNIHNPATSDKVNWHTLIDKTTWLAVPQAEPPPAGQQSRSSHIDPTNNLPETLGAAKLSQGRLRLTRIFH